MGLSWQIVRLRDDYLKGSALVDDAEYNAGRRALEILQQARSTSVEHQRSLLSGACVAKFPALHSVPALVYVVSISDLVRPSSIE